MKLLVTGGCGFIGSNFVRYWLNKYPKDTLTVLDKLTYAGHKENLSGLKYKFIHGDICDPDMVKKAMSGIDTVIHFAAESHVDRSVTGPADFIRTNVMGTQVLLSAAVAASVKLFHHVSTDEVFGALPLDRPDLKFSETSNYLPHSPYSASKASSDLLVRAWHSTYNLPVTISNTSNNYGPYQDPEKLIPRFITNLILDQKVPLMGKGENIRDWIHVLDHCRAIDLIVHRALENSDLIGQTFCVGGNSELTNLLVTREILKAFNRDDSWIETIPDRLGHDSRYAIDSSKINHLLGWQPAHDFTAGLAETISWYKQHQTWWQPLKMGRPNIDPVIQRKLIVK